ncbi:hypothetical protein [Pseudomonas putida]|uniref:hypothetical protein n=1 Tax=Pseudomonas putida TaxID=303 RepID=UPI003905B289
MLLTASLIPPAKREPSHGKLRVEHSHLDIKLHQRGQPIDGFSEVAGLGVEINFFDFGVRSHHGERAPEKSEHSIGHQQAALNLGLMERLRFS